MLNPLSNFCNITFVKLLLRSLLLVALLICNFLDLYSIKQTQQIGGDCREIIYSEDGKEIIALRDQSLIFYDSQTGEFKRMIPNLPGSGINLSSDEKNEKFLITNSGTNWDIFIYNKAGDFLKQYNNKLFVLTNILNRSGDKLYQFLPDSYYLVDYINNITIDSFSFNKGFVSSFFSKYGEFFGGIKDDSVYIYNTANKNLLGIFYTPQINLSSVAFSPDNSFFTYGGNDSIIRIFNISTKELRTFPYSNYNYNVRGPWLSPDNNYMAYYTYTDAFNFGINVVDINTGNIIIKFSKPINEFQFFNNNSGINFSPDSHQVIIMDDDQQVHIYNLPDGSEQIQINAVPDNFKNNSDNMIFDFSPTGDSVICSDEGLTTIWDLKNARRLNYIYGNYNWKDNVLISCINNTGRYFITTKYNSLVKWDLETGLKVSISPSFNESISQIFPFPDNNNLLIILNDGHFKLINIDTLQYVPGFNQNLSANDNTIITKDGKKIITYSGGYFVTYDAKTGSRIASIGLDSTLIYPEFNKEGSKVLGIYHGFLALFDLSNRKELKRYTMYSGPSRYSPDESKIIIYNKTDKQYEIHDSETFNKLDSFKFPEFSNFYVLGSDFDRIIFEDGSTANLAGKTLVFSLKSRSVTDILPVYDKNNISDKSILSVLTKSNYDINSWDINKKYINNSFWNNSEINYQFAKYLGDKKNLALINEKGIYIYDYQSKKYLDTLIFDNKMNYTFYDFDANFNSNNIIASANLDGTNYMLIWNYKNGDMKVIDADTTTMLNEPLISIALDKSGNTLYTCSDNNIFKWDVINSKIIKFYNKNGAIFNLVRIHPNGEQIFVSAKNSIYILKTSDLSVIDTISFDGNVSAFDINSNGSEISAVISFSLTNYFTIIDINSRKKSKILPLESEYCYSLYDKVKLKYSPDSKRILIDYASLVWVYDRIKNEMSGSLRSDVLFSNFDFINDTTMLIPGNKGLLYLMDITGFQNKSVINAPGENTIAISNYSQSQYIATYEGAKPAINLYDYDGRFLNSLNIYDMNGNLFDIIFNPKEETCFVNFASNSISYNYVRYNIKSSEVTEVSRGSKVFAISSDGKKYGIFNDKEIALYEDGKIMPIFKIPNKSGANLLIHNIAISPEGKMLAIATKDKKIEVYNTLNGQLISSIKAFEYNYYNMKFIPGSSVLCFSGSDFSNMIKFYNPIDGKPLDSINYSRTRDALIFNKTGTKMLIAGGNRSLYVYDIDFSELGDLEDKLTDVEVKDGSNINNKTSIYPNPAKDYIEIKLAAFNLTLKRGIDEYYDIQIFDMLGVIVLTVEQTSPSVRRIDISNLSPGMYFIKIGSRVDKFVKM